jgi:hypothetical protein
MDAAVSGAGRPSIRMGVALSLEMVHARFVLTVYDAGTESSQKA